METPSLSLKDTGRIYLDHNATTAPLQSVVSSIPEWLKSWGNPSSIHWSGRGPKNILRDSRARLAKLINCHPLELIFTGGGSEANNLIIKSAFENYLAHEKTSGRCEFITTTVEHPSVQEAFKFLEKHGVCVHRLNIDRFGRIDIAAYKKVLSEKTALVSVMFANNETGTIFPIRHMARLAHEVGAEFHSDGVQTLGKIPVDMAAWDVDYATFSAHKFYALKGLGMVYVRKGKRITSLVHGGGQERGRRAGTENVLAIAALGHMANYGDTLALRSEVMRKLRDEFESEWLKVPGVRVTGAGGERLPNTSSLVIDDVDGESLLMNLDMAGISVSTGAACSSGNPEPSPVLLAMGLSRVEAQSSLRVSLGWDTTSEEMHEFSLALKQIVERLRTHKWQGRASSSERGSHVRA